MLAVAVVVPTYGDARFLNDCLESVRRQTFSRWRCYVVDDASNDDVHAVLGPFLRRDDRFVAVRHGKNAGLSAARNTGLVLTEEALIQFLDADDLLTPWALERRVDVMRRHWHAQDVAGAYGYVAQCPVETKLSDLRSWRRAPDLGVQDWLSSHGECPFNVHAPLVRTDVVRRVGGFDESFRSGAEDWDLWQRILRHGFVFEPAKTIVGGYRQHPASMVRADSSAHLDRADRLLEASTKWALVDPQIAVADASMPIAQGYESLQRLRRAATWAGINGARLEDPVAAVDEDLIDFLGRDAMPGSRKPEVASAARAGLVRGFGLSPEVLHLLDGDAVERLDHAASAIADELYSHARRANPSAEEVVDLTARVQADVALVAETLADVAPLIESASASMASDGSVVALDLDCAKGEEGSGEAWRAHGVDVFSYNSFILGRITPQVILTRRPHGPVTDELCRIARERNIVVRMMDEADRGLNVADARLVKGERDDVTEAGTQDGTRIPTLGSRFTTRLPHEEGGIDPRSSAQLAKLRNSYCGETAVILGNGPSLNETDLDLLRDQHTFGVNSIFLARDRLSEPLSFYVVEDRAVFADNVDAIKRYEAGVRFFPCQYRHHFSEKEIGENTIFFRMNTGFYRHDTGTNGHPRFSTCAPQRLYCGQSVTIINLQLAHWLGFRKVVLIGMDFSYSIPETADRSGDVIVSRGPDQNHFHPDYFGYGKTWHDPKLDRVLVSYRLCNEIYRASGRSIVNATVGGELEVFERQPLAEALRSP